MRLITLSLVLALSCGTFAQKAGTVRQDAKGIAMVYVPGGLFSMGSNARPNERPLHKVHLSGYWIGKNDVTVSQFRRFCALSGFKFDWEGHKPSWGWKDTHPMVNVSWADARAFCKWAGGDLPTEAQWEKAARGSKAREYPWGKEWDPAKCWCSHRDFGDVGSTASVGSFPLGASPYACLDMSGNVWQWCLDWFSPSGYELRQSHDPKGHASGTVHVLRGGSWADLDPDFFRAAYRSDDGRSSRNGTCGFRLVQRRIRLVKR